MTRTATLARAARTTRTSATTSTPMYGGVPRDDVLSPFDRHFARRFTGGINPRLARQINRRGGGRAWFAQQLEPESNFTDLRGQDIDTWFPRLQRSPGRILGLQLSGEENAWPTLMDLSRWTVARQVHSNYQVKEVMVSFWSNLLHVPINSDTAMYARVDYDHVMRRYALDTFENLLQNAITHPAMGLNLSNYESTKDMPNENLGRELLELHTVGLGAGYTEDDVQASAKLLTGYRVWLWPAFKAEYTPSDHYVGPLDVMGFHTDNADPDGRAAVAAYLSYLAHHPATASRLARRLCVKFVNENPSDDLVATVARAYLDNGTAIKPTLLAMVGHPEFTDPVKSVRSKVRNPLEDYVATVRAVHVQIERPKSADSFANQMIYQYYACGMQVYGWPSPNGFPEVNAAWSSAGRILSSFDMHRQLAGKWWPKDDAVLWARSDLLPLLPATLDKVISVIGLKILGQCPTPEMCEGISTILSMPRDKVMQYGELKYNFWFVRTIVTSLLDSPIHMYR